MASLGPVRASWVRMFTTSLTIHNISAHLLGEGQLYALAVRGGQLGDALLDDGDVLLDLGDDDAFLLSQVLAGDSGQVDELFDGKSSGRKVTNSRWKS